MADGPAYDETSGLNTIEITPEMLRAGDRALSGFNPDWESSYARLVDVITAVFRADHRGRRHVCLDAAAVALCLTGRTTDQLSIAEPRGETMSFIQREIDRIRPLLVANPDQPELYAAQQALCWALEPSGVKSPYDMLTGAPSTSEVSEPAQ